MAIIADIEDAIINRLTDPATATALGYPFGTVGTYGGQLDHDDATVAYLSQQYPALWVYYAGESAPEALTVARHKWVATARFTLLVTTMNRRGEKAGRHGGPAGTGEIGAYQILDDLRRTPGLLLQEDLSLAISPLVPGGIKALISTSRVRANLTIYAQEWSCKYVFEAAPVYPSLLKVDLGYDITLDGIVDADDLVILQQ